MTTEGFKRKITAILSADVVGYSRLMGEDEAATVKTLATYREVMAALIKQHRGRMVDSPGDNVLAEFASVVDGVQCAVAVQKEFQSRNAELPEGRRMEFRIGINLGDVIEEEQRIYGDGVNIAARLEALADPGGICISKTAFDQIETKLPLGYEYMGEQTVKNIPRPVGAYRVFMEPRVTVAEEIEEEKVVPLWRRKAIFAGAIAVLVAAIAVAIWNFYLRPAPPPVEVTSKKAPTASPERDTQRLAEERDRLKQQLERLRAEKELLTDRKVLETERQRLEEEKKKLAYVPESVRRPINELRHGQGPFIIDDFEDKDLWSSHFNSQWRKFTRRQGRLKLSVDSGQGANGTSCSMKMQYKLSEKSAVGASIGGRRDDRIEEVEKDSLNAYDLSRFNRISFYLKGRKEKTVLSKPNKILVVLHCYGKDIKSRYKYASYYNKTPIFPDREWKKIAIPFHDFIPTPATKQNVSNYPPKPDLQNILFMNVAFSGFKGDKGFPGSNTVWIDEIRLE